MPQQGTILDAGCGLARFVRYLSQKGFKVVGIEWNRETVSMVNTLAPDLDVRWGDISQLPFKDNSMAGVISLGVVEHFAEGPEKPLEEMLRVLKPGAHGIITVPCVNAIRRVKYALRIYGLRRSLRRIRKKEAMEEDNPYCRHQTSFRRWPVSGRFGEYRFTKRQFEKEITEVGFSLVESVPIALMDGIYHEFGPAFVSFRNWRFYPNVLGKSLNYLLSQIPFFHNHMHLCVVKK